MHDYIENIRAAYTKNLTSKYVTKRQISVATYLIDIAALRAGNEKVYFVYIYFSYAYLIFLQTSTHPRPRAYIHMGIGICLFVNKHYVEQSYQTQPGQPSKLAQPSRQQPFHFFFFVIYLFIYLFDLLILLEGPKLT